MIITSLPSLFLRMMILIVALCGNSILSAAPTTIDVWYGNYQRFGDLGEPQRQVNILGNVSDPVGIQWLKYSLNGGPDIKIKLGPVPKKPRRLVGIGDFNVELQYADLTPGQNFVVLTAKNAQGEQTSELVTLNYASGNTWPNPYAIDWQAVAGIQDVAQVVDGEWAVTTNGVRTLAPGYDRLVAVGGITWADYEITAPVTVHSIDPVCLANIDNCRGSPGVSLLVRWQGHYAWGAAQPTIGYYPIGAAGSYDFKRTDLTQGELKLKGGEFQELVKDSSRFLAIGSTNMFKMRAETIAGVGHQYSFKVWPQGTPEPPNWDLVSTEPLTSSSLPNGSALLVAHNVDVTFGNVTVTPIGQPVPVGIGPEISNVQAAATDTTATITWVTNVAATSRVDYGTTTAYGGLKTDNALKTQHSIEITGLTAGTLYHYQVSSADAEGDETSHSDLTFTTDPDSGPGGTSSGMSSDHFGSGTLDPGVWTFVDPLGDSTQTMSGASQASIAVPAGVTHDIWKNANFAPRIRQAANDTDFEIEVKFDSLVTSQYQLQGIVVEQDQGNVLRFDFHHDGSGTRIFAATLKDGKPTKRLNNSIGDGAPLYMRVTRLGNQWTQSYSYDGVNWDIAGSFTHDIVVTSAGVFGGNAGSSPPAHTVLVDYFMVDGIAPP